VLLSEKIYCGNALQLRIEGDIFVRFSPGARSGGAVIMFARGITCRLCGLERVGTRSWSLEHRYGGIGGAVPKSHVLVTNCFGTTPINRPRLRKCENSRKLHQRHSTSKTCQDLYLFTTLSTTTNHSHFQSGEKQILLYWCLLRW